MITWVSERLPALVGHVRRWLPWGTAEGEARLIISTQLWVQLVSELARRGRGRRESGAFLLGPSSGDPRQVTEVVYLDDLDPNCLTGGISFDGRYYGILWDHCHANSLHVRADVHTHPHRSVSQSWIDRDNPMVSRPGHIALIVPNLAQSPVSAAQVGVHEFLGADGWRSWFGAEAEKMLVIEQ